jgi:REP-associated tyrosine transposase
MPARPSAHQLDLDFRPPRRKRRVRRGRPTKPDALVPHAPRLVKAPCPLHVTLRMHRHVWQLRSGRCFRILERAFYRGSDRFGGRVCHFSVQRDHIHLVVEAADPTALARALQGLCIRMAKGLNRLMGRKGAVFADRYHARSLGTPTEVRRALIYVLRNGQKHLPKVGHRLPAGWLDPYSSAAWFDGWSTPAPPLYRPGPVAPPTSWLLTTGYLRAGGPLRLDEVPTS